MSFLTVHFAPGDGTQYRAVLAQLDPEESEKNHVGPHGIFYAFGVGNRPVTGYFFDRKASIDFGYFYEKLQGCADGYPATVYMAWLTLLALLGRELPDQLPQYRDDAEPPERWYRSLNAGWVHDGGFCISPQNGALHEFGKFFWLSGADSLQIATCSLKPQTLLLPKSLRISPNAGPLH